MAVNGRAPNTVSVPDEADIADYIDQMAGGDILSLAEDGAYTLGAGEQLFETLPSGYPGSYTTVQGNGATITGGQDGIYLYGKSYIRFVNVNLRDQTRYCVTYDACHHIQQTGCTYASTVGTDFVDVLKIYRSDELLFTDCTVEATTGLATCDGFEFWGPCKNVRVTNCVVDGITGSASPDHHAFEVYANDADDICENITFDSCEGNGCDVGFSVEGGPGAVAHVNIRAVNCTATDSDDYDAQGIDGSTLYVTADTLTNRNGTVTEL